MLPFFSPIRRVAAHRLLGQRRFHHCTINTLPAPGDALHLVVLGKARLPYRFKETRSLPLKESFVDGTCAVKALLGQRLPLAASAQYIDDGLKHLSGRLGRSSRPWFANIDFVCNWAKGNQWLHPPPELIANFP